MVYLRIYLFNLIICCSTMVSSGILVDLLLVFLGHPPPTAATVYGEFTRCCILMVCGCSATRDRRLHYRIIRLCVQRAAVTRTEELLTRWEKSRLAARKENIALSTRCTLTSDVSHKCEKIIKSDPISPRPIVDVHINCEAQREDKTRTFIKQKQKNEIEAKSAHCFKERMRSRTSEEEFAQSCCRLSVGMQIRENRLSFYFTNSIRRNLGFLTLSFVIWK